MVSGFLISPNDHDRIRSGDARETLISSNVFIGATLKGIAGKFAQIETDDGSKFETDLFFQANPKGQDFNDHTSLIYLSDATLLENSRVRYAKDEIYTFCGPLLVAVAGAPPSADVSWTLRVEGWMPGHGHGMLRQAVVDELGDGRYRVRGMLFHMPGLWELRVLVIETRMEEDYRVVEDDKVAIEVTL